MIKVVRPAPAGEVHIQWTEAYDRRGPGGAIVRVESERIGSVPVAWALALLGRLAPLQDRAIDPDPWSGSSLTSHLEALRDAPEGAQVRKHLSEIVALSQALAQHTGSSHLSGEGFYDEGSYHPGDFVWGVHWATVGDAFAHLFLLGPNSPQDRSNDWEGWALRLRAAAETATDVLLRAPTKAYAFASSLVEGTLITPREDLLDTIPWITGRWGTKAEAQILGFARKMCEAYPGDLIRITLRGDPAPDVLLATASFDDDDRELDRAQLDPEESV